MMINDDNDNDGDELVYKIDKKRLFDPNKCYYINKKIT